ncbi:MAG: LysM peptidoglycan-binding domain-containing protein [Candidatus Promineofilum sp.]|nr:LysM peptidoglycan-binding domain-containing protein [Promineifilum sp.]
MKRTTYPLLLAAMALLVLALSACVRPAPGTENLPEATATLPGALLPTLPLPTATIPIAASPTPLPLPAEASPTPLPPAVEPTAAPAVQPTAPATGERIHVVAAGENLFRIGLQYGFTAEELATYNNIPNVDRIYVGQEIRIPAK